jgi:hypothetical protein
MEALINVALPVFDIVLASYRDSGGAQQRDAEPLPLLGGAAGAPVQRHGAHPGARGAERLLSRRRRRRYHPTLGIGVEVVSGALFDGASDRAKIRVVDVGNGHRVAIAAPKDMVADRLGQYCSTSNRVPPMLDQAVKMWQLAGDLDEAYLDKRIRDETLGELDLAFLKARAA